MNSRNLFKEYKVIIMLSLFKSLLLALLVYFQIYFGSDNIICFAYIRDGYVIWHPPTLRLDMTLWIKYLYSTYNKQNNRLSRFNCAAEAQTSWSTQIPWHLSSCQCLMSSAFIKCLCEMNVWHFSESDNLWLTQSR